MKGGEVLLGKLRSFYNNARVKAVQTVANEDQTPKVEKMLAKYRQLGLTKEEQIALLQSLQKAIDGKIEELKEESRVVKW